MIANDLYVLAVLSLLIAASDWMVRHTWLKHVGTALFVILVTAVVANLGVLPAGSTEAAPVPVYDWIFAVAAPLSILWILLRVSLRDILDAGGPIIFLFLTGSIGTMVGVAAGLLLVGAPDSIGPMFGPLGGMFVGTYTGGSVNFNTLALEYDVITEPVLFGGAVVVDNIVTALWMIATLSLPRLLAPLWPRSGAGEPARERGEVILGIEEDTEVLHPLDLGLMLALGFGALWISEVISMGLSRVGVGFPSILILTVLALVLAQIPAIGRLRGSRTLAMFAVYLFLAVIGAFCDLTALRELGSLAPVLLLFALTVALVHGAITFGAARLFRIDPDVAAVASQANIGGGTSALALARSLSRDDLVLPAVLVGSLGLALGSFLGFFMVETVIPILF